MKKSKKNIVVSADVLIYDTEALKKFGSNQIIIPANVLAEIFKASEYNTEKGYYAKEVIELLSKTAEKQNTTLKKGIVIGETTVKVKYNLENKEIKKKVKYPKYSRIIGCAINNNAMIVTKDKRLLLTGRDFVETEEYFADKIKSRTVYKGYAIEEVKKEVVDTLYKKGFIENSFNLSPNEFILLKSESNQSAIGICKKNKIQLCDFDEMFFKAGIRTKTKPINLEQKMFLYLLLDDDVKLVTCSGVSGKGKTLLSVDYALNAIEQQKFYKLMFTKSVIPVDKNEELGFYKGSLNDKLKPHLQPLYNSVEFLYKDEIYSKNDKVNSTDEKVEKMIEADILNFYPLANIRGMSIYNKVVILDEAQNITNHMIKSLVTRLNDNSKLIVLGDIEQIDKEQRHLNKYNNGLVHLIEKGMPEEFIGHITMDIDKKSKRGDVASFGANIL